MNASVCSLALGAIFGGTVETVPFPHVSLVVTLSLYVCTFGKGSSRKEHHVVLRRRIATLEATEVSDASSHYMSG